MQILINCLYVLEVLVSLLLAGVVMLQKPKDGGLNVAMGGGMGESLFGAQMGNVLTRTTIIFGSLFLLNTLILSVLVSYNSSGPVREGVKTPAPAPVEQPAALPMPAP
ncbi:MAG: preprotein translocase subunit SecG, partial [Kiritimatiellae bacterium]|nr:preprotein translocase subunit SecG [Kiritimatiellia bacterium]